MFPCTQAQARGGDTHRERRTLGIIASSPPHIINIAIVLVLGAAGGALYWWVCTVAAGGVGWAGVPMPLASFGVTAPDHLRYLFIILFVVFQSIYYTAFWRDKGEATRGEGGGFRWTISAAEALKNVSWQLGVLMLAVALAERALGWMGFFSGAVARHVLDIIYTGGAYMLVVLVSSVFGLLIAVAHWHARRGGAIIGADTRALLRHGVVCLVLPLLLFTATLLLRPGV